MCEDPVTVITCLGLALRPDGSPSANLKKRCVLAAQMAKELPTALVIPTGGDPARAGITEAGVMANVLVEMGVARERLLLEEEALDTTDNAYNVLRIVENIMKDKKRVMLMLVTSQYHMPRAAWLFRVVATALGLQVVLELKAVKGDEDRNGAMQEARILEWMPRSVRLMLDKNGVESEKMEDLSRPNMELTKLIIG